jgi:hypothetical protein
MGGTVVPHLTDNAQEQGQRSRQLAGTLFLDPQVNDDRFDGGLEQRAFQSVETDCFGKLDVVGNGAQTETHGRPPDVRVMFTDRMPLLLPEVKLRRASS